MSCQNCKSQRVANITGKCAGTCVVKLFDLEIDGIIPDDLGIGGGDYLRFDVCFDCGYMQGNWPIPLSYIEKDLPDQDIEDFFFTYFGEGEAIKNPGYRWLDPILKEAKDLSSKFGKFVEEFFDIHTVVSIRSDGTKQYKYPTVDKFIQMFRTNKPWLED